MSKKIKRCNRINIRLTDKEYDFIKNLALEKDQSVTSLLIDSVKRVYKKDRIQNVSFWITKIQELYNHVEKKYGKDEYLEEEIEKLWTEL